MPQKMAVTELLSVLLVLHQHAISAKDFCLICVLQLASVHKLEQRGVGSACT